MINLEQVFEKYHDDYLNFDCIENKPHSRQDICAFLLLDKLVPGNGRDMVSAAKHDGIFLDVDCEALAKVATEEDIQNLIRCGVCYDESLESLHMHV